MRLSIIIPCYNEIRTIKECLNRVLSVDLGDIEKEIIIVDDGSTDGTREVLKKIKDNPVKTILHSRNLGKGSAIRTALHHITGDVVLIQDADLEYDPQDYHALVRPIVEGKAKVVYGSRALLPHQRSYWRYHWGGKFLTFLANLLYNAKITDESTCYKVFSTEVIKGVDLKCNKFEFCPEITAKVLRKGYKMYEVPIHYIPRSMKQGKKIRWMDGIIAIWTLVKYRVVPRKKLGTRN